MSTIGFPDGQRIAQWLGSPVVQATALPLGAGVHTDGPFSLASWASVVLALKPTGGNVTAKVKQAISGGPVSLVEEADVTVVDGNVVFESVVLFGDAVTLELDGAAAGMTLDYALYPSNVTTNAQVAGSTTAVISRVNALPATPADSQVVSLIVDAVNFPGVEWLCIYNSATGWWDVIGGSPVFVYDANIIAEPNTAAWAVFGATTLTLAHEGYYDLRVEGSLQNTFAGAAETDLGLRIDGVDPADPLDAATVYSGAAGPRVQTGRDYYNQHVAAGGVVRPVFASQQTSTIGRVKYRAMPRRIK